MKIEINFSISQRVIIPELDNAKAMVTAIRISWLGVQYLVSWFNNGKREEEFMNEDQLKAAERY